MDINTARNGLSELQSKLSAYSHAIELISYDQATTAPKGASENLAHALGILSEELYRLSTGDETVCLLEYLDSNSDSLSFEEKRMVYLLLKEIRRLQKIPMNEYVEYQSLLATAFDIWLDAKLSSNFELFRPTLEKIFETTRRFAKYCNPDVDAYDYWLDQFEPGLNMEKCEDFFATLKERIVPLVDRIKNAPQTVDSCLHGLFSSDKQEKFSHRIMKTMGIDSDHCILGTTEHPFTTTIGSHLDERITTHYVESDFSSSMFSVIHESGHALYDMGSGDSLIYTVLDGGISMGIHESQSRFYENILGRSRAFTAFLLSEVKAFFADENRSLEDLSPDQFYRAVNKVEPSLIRTEADEVTYCLHVMVRYEMEKKAMSGQLEVKDFPYEWNRLYKEYLGVDVPDDRHGVLQDSHWAGGLIGYFPSYALGSAYGAQFLKKMKESIDVDACLSRGDFSEINEWNKNHIWKYGKLYEPYEILERVLGEDFDPNVFADYLESKYSEIYGL